MRSDSSWDDDEIKTGIFVRPDAHAVLPIPPRRTPRGTQPTPTLSLLANDAFSIPSLANVVEPEAPSTTLSMRRYRLITPRHLVIAIVFALLGITIGGLIAFSGHAPAAPAAHQHA